MDKDRQLSFQLIERDYHPIPQEHTNPDHMIMPMVVPAHLDRIRFDVHNPAQTTFLDIRNRMYSELLKVVGFDFIECFTFSQGSTPRTTRALDVLQVAYLATECVKEMASLFEVDRAAFASGSETMTKTVPRLPAPVECPMNMTWCCVYTPTGIENLYWVIERSMCQYTLFVLSMQMAFLHLHMHRRAKYTTSGAEKDAEKVERAQNPARVCRMHLDVIIAAWETGYFSNLATFGMVPEREVMEKTFGDIIALMQFDYRIFHIELPMFMDRLSVWKKVQDTVLIPRAIVTEQDAILGVGNEAIRKHTMATLATLLMAYKKSTSVYSDIFAETMHDPSGSDTYMRSLTIRHSCLTQLAKYLMQAPLVYRFLVWVLKFNLVVRDRKMYLIDRCFHQINAMFKDPCFRLFIYQGSNAPRILEQVDAINRERLNAVKLFNTNIMAVQSCDYARTDVAIPGEIYECDLLFSIWSMQTFAQFPPVLVSSFIHILDGLNNFIKKSPLVKLSEGGAGDGDDTTSAQLPGIDDEVIALAKTATKPTNKRKYVPSSQAAGFVNKFVKSCGRTMLLEQTVVTEVEAERKHIEQKEKKGEDGSQKGYE